MDKRSNLRVGWSINEWIVKFEGYPGLRNEWKRNKSGLSMNQLRTTRIPGGLVLHVASPLPEAALHMAGLLPGVVVGYQRRAAGHGPRSGVSWLQTSRCSDFFPFSTVFLSFSNWDLIYTSNQILGAFTYIMYQRIEEEQENIKDSTYEFHIWCFEQDLCRTIHVFAFIMSSLTPILLKLESRLLLNYDADILIILVSLDWPSIMHVLI